VGTQPPGHSTPCSFLSPLTLELDGRMNTQEDHLKIQDGGGLSRLNPCYIITYQTAAIVTLTRHG